MCYTVDHAFQLIPLSVSNKADSDYSAAAMDLSKPSRAEVTISKVGNLSVVLHFTKSKI
jgi:hypothetical protein